MHTSGEHFELPGVHDMEKWKEHRSGKLPRKLNTSLLKCAHTKSCVLNCFGISLPTGSSYSSDKYQRCTPRIVIELSWKILTFCMRASCSFHFSMSLCVPNVTIHNVMFSVFSPYVLPFKHHVNNN